MGARMIAGLGRFTLIAEQRVLSPSKTVSGNLMKRCVPVFTRLAVVKVSLRLVSVLTWFFSA